MVCNYIVLHITTKFAAWAKITKILANTNIHKFSSSVIAYKIRNH